MNQRKIRSWLIAAVVLQAVALACLPLFAGARMPQGAVVTLEAKSGESPDFKEMPRNELWLDYGFRKIKLPESLEPGDSAYLELRRASKNQPVKYGRIVADPDSLPDGSTWIKLPVISVSGADSELESGSIGFWYDDDESKIQKLQTVLEEGGKVHVKVQLDSDGDPEIQGVRPMSG